MAVLLLLLLLSLGVLLCLFFCSHCNNIVLTSILLVSLFNPVDFCLELLNNKSRTLHNVLLLIRLTLLSIFFTLFFFTVFLFHLCLCLHSLLIFCYYHHIPLQAPSNLLLYPLFNCCSWFEYSYILFILCFDLFLQYVMILLCMTMLHINMAYRYRYTNVITSTIILYP